ncbi:ABC transporter substrate-binding protein [Variovorax sp. dw_308]|uniref:ABC transporter substrate-binding protein n=1 Tax=Variovorax sp. dw_308 TaxID=2721546 RepID=UPI001C484785|nr:ABC transporter substrate-binding protein [Variovorax sp. dw_308]
MSLTVAMWMRGARAAAGDDASRKMHIATLGPGLHGCPPGPAGDAFTKGLSVLGYGPHNLSVESRCYTELADIPRFVVELLSTDPVLVVVWGSVVAVGSVRRAAPTLPIVFIDVADPVQFGLVESLGHPGGYTTGISNNADEVMAKKVQILRDALPHAARLALLFNLSNPLQEGYLRTLQAAARTMNFETHTYSVQSRGELDGAFAAMSADRMDGMVLGPDAWFYPLREQVVMLAALHQIPAIFGNTAYSEAGALFSYGADLNEMSYHATAFVDKILKGAKPGSLPVELPTKYNLLINAKAARALGLSIPPGVMLRATQVIE